MHRLNIIPISIKTILNHTHFKGCSNRKEIEEKILSCVLPASLRTVNNWQKFLEKEVARVTQLQNQLKDIEEQLRNRESQAISF